jgi:uncharacterized cofD-like protein
MMTRSAPDFIDAALIHCYHQTRMHRQNSWWKEALRILKREARWLVPGIGVKRWVLTILAGVTLLAIGLAFLLINIYRTVPESLAATVIATVSLQFLDRLLRALIFGLVGLALVGYGFWGLNRSLLRPFIQPGKAIIDSVSAYRKKEKGPRVVVIGGGNGLSTLLRGLKEHTRNLTAIVTVADDGGSSGELRRNMGVLPPGDIRNCLAALSDDEELLTQLFQYRFSDATGLGGHSLGNLFITGLAEITGSFEEAIVESGRVLAVQGKVLPSTLTDVHLVADVAVPEKTTGVRVKGESRITEAEGRVRRIWLEPDAPPAYPPALQAILAADVLVIGPGSLYTSILPNLLVPDIVDAIRASKAIKFYICNLATQRGETDGYSTGDHVHAIEKHVGGRIFDLIICNNHWEGDLPRNVSWVTLDPALEENYPLYLTDLSNDENPWRHDSRKLAQVVMDIYYDRTGPLPEKEQSPAG